MKNYYKTNVGPNPAHGYEAIMCRNAHTVGWSEQTLHWLPQVLPLLQSVRSKWGLKVLSLLCVLPQETFALNNLIVASGHSTASLSMRRIPSPFSGPHNAFLESRRDLHQNQLDIPDNV